jgi:hypothetical protein
VARWVVRWRGGVGKMARWGRSGLVSGRRWVVWGCYMAQVGREMGRVRWLGLCVGPFVVMVMLSKGKNLKQ